VKNNFQTLDYDSPATTTSATPATRKYTPLGMPGFQSMSGPGGKSENLQQSITQPREKFSYSCSAVIENF
jgi:hypothetical protein